MMLLKLSAQTIVLLNYNYEEKRTYIVTHLCAAVAHCLVGHVLVQVSF